MRRSLNPPLDAREKEKLDEVKRQLCWRLRQSIARRAFRPGYAAIKVGTSRARITQVECGQIENLSFNQLFTYLVRLEPKFEVLIAF